MAKKGRTRAKAILAYPEHVLQPADLLHFIYLDEFFDEAKGLKLGEDDITAIEIMIMAGGKDSPVMRGTGGLRKMRFAPESWNCGKSGAARVCFVHFKAFWTVLMVTIYRKSEFDNLSNEAKREIARLISDAETELKQRRQIN